MNHEVDVVVLGLGTSGEDLALQLLDAGLEVAGVEAQLLGGECPYWACIPSKVMIRAGNLLQEARRANGVAGTTEVTPDWSLVAARIRDYVTGGWDDSYAVARFEGKEPEASEVVAAAFASEGIEVVIGEHARSVSEKSSYVD